MFGIVYISAALQHHLFAIYFIGALISSGKRKL
jgi:hypothetical protein